MIDDNGRLGPKLPGEFRIAYRSDLHISADYSELRSRFRAWLGARLQQYIHRISRWAIRASLILQKK